MTIPLADASDANDAPDVRRLERLLRSGHRCVSILTFEEADALHVVRAALENLGGGGEVLRWSVVRGVHDGRDETGPAVSDTDHPAAALYFFAGLTRPVTAVLLDLVPHLKDDRTMRTFRETLRAFEKQGSRVILIDAVTEVPPAVRAVATPLELTLPDERALEQIVRETVRACSTPKRPIEVTLTRRDLQAILRNLRGLNARQARQLVRDACLDDRKLDTTDLEAMLTEKRRLMSGEGLLEYVQAPVSLDEIGGVRRLKYWLEQRRAALCDEAAAFGVPPPRGILLLGVQGAGKSLAAKAVATAWQRPLLRMDVGAMYDKFIGESERRLREAFRQAEMMSPIILWIDEIEKAFASAAAQSADGGLSKRMFGALLTWMQEHRAPVFVVATANDIEALPPELLRKGRFDEIFFVDLPDAEARRMIFSIHLARRKRDPQQFDLDKLAAAADGYSGAEIEQGIIAALNDAFARHADLTDDGIVTAIRNSPPLSVIMAERMAGLRQWAQGRCVPAD